MLKICELCGSEYKTSHSERRFCSSACYGQHKSKNGRGENNPNWRGGVEKECCFCGKKYADNSYSNSRFCSKVCAGKHKSSQVKIVACKTCGNEFEYRSHGDGRVKEHCSPKCSMNDASVVEKIQSQRRGFRMTAEARDKISVNSSMRNTGYTRGKGGMVKSTKGGEFFYRSSYELRAVNLMDNSAYVTSFEYEPVTIIYFDTKGQKRRYRPDFIVNWIDGTRSIVEVKPTWNFDDTKFIEKSVSASMYAKNKGMNFVVWDEWTLGIKDGSTPMIELKSMPQEAR